MTIGGIRYRAVVTGREGGWIAHAERESGERFGIECAGSTEDEVVEALVQWLAWQQEHSAALEALQEAERAYHRAVAGSAFSGSIEDASIVELQRDALEQLQDARERLDAARMRKPERIDPRTSGGHS